MSTNLVQQQKVPTALNFPSTIVGFARILPRGLGLLSVHGHLQIVREHAEREISTRDELPPRGLALQCKIEGASLPKLNQAVGQIGCRLRSATPASPEVVLKRGPEPNRRANPCLWFDNEFGFETGSPIQVGIRPALLCESM